MELAVELHSDSETTSDPTTQLGTRKRRPGPQGTEQLPAKLSQWPGDAADPVDEDWAETKVQQEQVPTTSSSRSIHHGPTPPSIGVRRVICLSHPALAAHFLLRTLRVMRVPMVEIVGCAGQAGRFCATSRAPTKAVRELQRRARADDSSAGVPASELRETSRGVTQLLHSSMCLSNSALALNSSQGWIEKVPAADRGEEQWDTRACALQVGERGARAHKGQPSETGQAASAHTASTPARE